MLRRFLGAALLAVVLTTAGGAASTHAATPPDDLAQASIGALQSVVTVLGVRSHESLQKDPDGRARRPRSLASGIVIDARGRILTVASAVRDCDAIAVRLDDGRELPAMLLGIDEDSDVALLSIPATDLIALKLAPAGADPVGNPVSAVGSGVGKNPRISYGAVRRVYTKPLGSLLLLSNDVYPGSSGGAALNARGELLGMVIGRLDEAPPDWADAPSAGSATFAVHADDLRTLITHLENYGVVRRGFLGVRMVQGEIVDAERPGTPFKVGVRVEDVLPGSPAARIDLRAGDLVVGWGGETLQSPEDLMRRVEGSPPGTIIPLVWVRNDERREGKLVVGARPDDELLATPAGAGATSGEDSLRDVKSHDELLERVRALRAKTPGAPDSSSRAKTGG